MQEEGFEINNNILHFIHNDSDYLIDLDLLEMISLYKNCVIFVECGKVIRVPSIIFNLSELTIDLLDFSNYMVCDSRHIINMKHIISVHIESLNDEEDCSKQHIVVLTFKNGTKENIVMNSWIGAEKLYHSIDDSLIELKINQTFEIKEEL